MAIVYILHSVSTERFYIGSTNDFERRYSEHNRGQTPSTRNGLPWKCVYKESYASYKEAAYRERQLKGWKSHKRIRELIDRSAG